jgi:hypothetical protein
VTSFGIIIIKKKKKKAQKLLLFCGDGKTGSAKQAALLNLN